MFDVHVLSSLALILTVWTSEILTQTIHLDEHGKPEKPRFVLCRSCGRDVADPSYLLTLTSTLSPFDARQQNLTSLFGSTSVPLQSLTNPHGHTFDVVLFQKAGCLAQGPWVAEDTWFPGYAWRICVCGACGRHLGWMYEPLDEIELSPSEPSEQGFYGLILTKLIDEECTFIIKDILGLLTS